MSNRDNLINDMDVLQRKSKTNSGKLYVVHLKWIIVLQVSANKLKGLRAAFECFAETKPTFLMQPVVIEDFQTIEAELTKLYMKYKQIRKDRKQLTVG